VPGLATVALGDAVVRGTRSALSFVPDELVGDEPEVVKRGLRESLARLIPLDFENMLLAHGKPFVGDGRSALVKFLAGGARRAAA